MGAARALSLGLLLCLGCAPDADDRPPALPSGLQCETSARPEGELLLAGSGAMLGLARALGQRWRGEAAGRRFHVAASIGTSGAVRALADGAIDVGLAARPLKANERALGLMQTHLARAAVAFAVHPDVRVTNLSGAQLVDLFEGRTRSWPDGTAVRLLVREPGDSGVRTIAAVRPQLAAAMARAASSGRAEVLYTDQQMGEALHSTPGAIGPVDAAMVAFDGLAARLPMMDGVAVDRASAVAGRWPLLRDLFLLTRADAATTTLDFVQLAGSATTADVFTQGAIVQHHGQP